MKRVMNICGLSLLSDYVEIDVERLNDFNRIFVSDSRCILIQCFSCSGGKSP